MIHVVTYTAKNKLTSFLPNRYNGSARHTTQSDAQHTHRHNLASHPEAQVITFVNMRDAGKWLNLRNDAERIDF